MRVGVIGLGGMGRAIAERLVERGFSLHGWNRSPARAEGIAGLTPSGSPAALIGAVDAAIVMLFDDAAAEAVYRGEGGILSAPLAGKLVIDMSTLRPDTMGGLESGVAEAGGRFLACPVGGTTKPAREGRLLGLAGGAAETLAAAQPLLGHLCAKIHHIGPAPAAAAMKLAINLPLAAFMQAFGEANLILRRFGLDPQAIVDVVSESSGAAPVLKARAAGIVAGLKGEMDSPVLNPGFALATVAKDLSLILLEAEAAMADLPLARATHAMANTAALTGLADRDMAALPGFNLHPPKP